MNRHRTITTKVKTPFASLYTHVCFNDKGQVTEVSISSPGKFSDTEVGGALTALTEAINEAFKEVHYD